MPIDRNLIRENLKNTVEQIPEILGKPRKFRGKVRDIFDAGDKLILIATDRQSAFDRILASVPFKSQVLNQISKFWFDATADICKNHLISTPDPAVAVVEKAEVFPVEVVVRQFLTGSTDTSAWVNYKNGVRDFCGIRLPENLKKNDKFESPIITPTTKDKNHDRPISAAEIIAEGRASEKEWEEISEKALKIFARGAEIFAKNGLILVDTKFEFGKNSRGEIILIDEVLTPDSSRFWLAETFAEKISKNLEPESFDKEFLRLWFVENCDPYRDKVLPAAPPDLIVELSARYIFAFEKITGKNFVPNLENSLVRLEKNLRGFF